MESFIKNGFLFTRNLLLCHFSGVLCYYLHCGELYGERVSPLRAFPLLHAGDCDSLAQRSCNLREGVPSWMLLFTSLMCSNLGSSWNWQISFCCALPGVCQLPWFPDRLQSHTFRWRKQSRSARLRELQACGAQVALHANKSESSWFDFLRQNSMSEHPSYVCISASRLRFTAWRLEITPTSATSSSCLQRFCPSTPRFWTWAKHWSVAFTRSALRRRTRGQTSIS